MKLGIEHLNALLLRHFLLISYLLIYEDLKFGKSRNHLR